ncbi:MULTISPECIES: PAS-domain containing protein [unclassified Bradyrhizobium]|uniref:PAS-domain containing protein n=2 Tax=unclassified Bradyrhizobium TaxID=2631580 RepID=UPI001CD5FE36|nr:MULTISPECIES: PAS-domain containing protein [unclassified Bradyrhizobium]MCA1383870.1 PAS-domain containing protein [Bradyrhizobium sp. BRP05]MCA1387688.1 PAS-domain containing protein [Bradyrhizobium sp. IC3123]MCA1418108.1 PAS-domain containing protein [Bradyrhizobium sp. BRP23]
MGAAALESGFSAGTKFLKKLVRFVRGADTLTVAEKVYSIAAFLAIVTTFLLVMSVQSVRLQTTYRHLHATSADAAVGVGRINALIYAVVMESRGIYMSADRAAMKQFADGLVRRNRELAEAVKSMERTVGDDDAELFSSFRQRIQQFIDFRQELVRRGVEISPAAAREWGDNDANRTLRSKLNSDLEALERIYEQRAREADELADSHRYAAAYLFALGLVALMLAALNVVVMRNSVIGALADITQATDRIAQGDVKSEVPHLRRHDEIGRLARAVQNFRDAVARIFELEELELGTAQARDAAMTERDKFNDKYQAKKWQLSAAINNMPQGLIMLDGKANVVAMNANYRRIYNLPETIQTGSSLEEILQHRVESGLFSGDVTKYVAAVLDRIAKRQPTSYEIALNDGRIIKIYERPMDGGGWVSVQEDVTEQRHRERILERMERFLATIIENVAEGIIAKDARNLRYVFVNKAAEKMIGMSRGEIIGKTARELFSVEAAELIERRDQQLLAQRQQLEPIIDTIDNPVRGRRVICARRIQVGGAGEESHMFVTMVEDRTERPAAAA